MPLKSLRGRSIFTYPDGSKQTVTQTAKFTRTAIKDLVDNTVEYGTWQGNDIFAVVDVPQFDGYYSSPDVIHSMEPTPSTIDQVVDVTYSAKPITTRIIQYVDENDQLIRADTISGQVDSHVAYQLKLPEHWTFVDKRHSRWCNDLNRHECQGSHCLSDQASDDYRPNH